MELVHELFHLFSLISTKSHNTKYLIRGNFLFNIFDWLVFKLYVSLPRKAEFWDQKLEVN